MKLPKNRKKVLERLQKAVERVREFAYAQPPEEPIGRPRIGVALGGYMQDRLVRRHNLV